MRTLTDHQVEGQNDALAIHAHDAHTYEIALNGIGSGNAEAGGKHGPIPIRFQTGPVKHGVVNGVTLAALLCIVIDRLRALQSGPQACAEYAAALSSAEAALEPLRYLDSERVKQERIEAERLAAEKLEAERVAAERRAAEKLEAERIEAERAAAAQSDPPQP